MMRPIGILVASALALAGCQSSGSSSGGSTAERTAPSAAPKIVRAIYEDNGRSFALPPGDWRLIDRTTINEPVNHSAPQTFSVLASVTDKVIDRVAVVWVQRKYRYKNRWSQYKGCLTTRDSAVYHSVVKANTGSDSEFRDGLKVDCWHARALSLGTKGEVHPFVRELRAYARANGLYLPAVMVGARFAQKPLFDRRDYVEIMWNPDLLAPSSAGKPWTVADWQASAVKADPAKKAVMDGIVTWGTDWRARHPISSPAGPTS